MSKDKTLSKEALMTPRVQVVYGWPNFHTHFRIGDVLTLKSFEENAWYCKDEAGLHAVSPKEVEKYPKLFKRLNWWDERNLSELPKYLYHRLSMEYRKVLTYGTYDVGVEVVQVDDELAMAENPDARTFQTTWPLSACEPATEDEYLAYKQSPNAYKKN